MLKKEVRKKIFKPKKISKLLSVSDKYKIKSACTLSLTEIFAFNDIFIQYYCLINNTNKDLRVSEEYADSIVNLIGLLKKHAVLICSSINIDQDILKYIKTRINCFTKIETVIKLLACININENDFKYFRKHFGYNLIYKIYKQLIDEQNSISDIKKELYIVLQLLENSKICYNKLLGIYKKLNYYLENKIYDANFIHCCVILLNLLRYDTNISDANLKDFLMGFSVYLFNLITSSNVYSVFKLNDIQNLVELINLIYKNSNLNFKKGFFEKCIKGFKILFTGIYEDIVIQTFLLQIFCKILEIYVPQQNLDLKTLHTQLIMFEIPSPNCVEYQEIIPLYLKYKYKVLDKLKIEYDMIYLYKDLFKYSDCNYIILSSVSLPLYCYIDNLIILINNSNNKIQYLKILFKESNIEFISYYYLYLTALKNNYKDILCFVVYFTKIEIEVNSKYNNLLFLLYFDYVEINDVYINKSRIYVVHRILIELKKNEELLKILISEIKKHKKFKKNIFILIYLIIKSIEKIEKEECLFLFKYIKQGYNNKENNFISTKYLERNEINQSEENIFKNTQNSIKNMKKQEELTNINNFNSETNTINIQFERFKCNLSIKDICIITSVNLILKYSNQEILQTLKEASYCNIIIILLVCKLSDVSINVIKDEIFKFVFICSKKERSEIRKLLENLELSKYGKLYLKYKNL